MRFDPLTEDMRPLEVKTLTAEKLKVAVDQVFDKDLLGPNVELSFMDREEDFFRNQVLVRMAQTLLSREVRQVESVELVPLTWWDAAKDTFRQWWPWLGWRLVRTVRSRRIETVAKVYHTCPHIKTPDNAPHFKWLAGGEGA